MATGDERLGIGSGQELTPINKQNNDNFFPQSEFQQPPQAGSPKSRL